MGWGNKFPDLKNDPSYLEGRLSNAEMSLAQIAINVKNPGMGLTPAMGNDDGNGNGDDDTAALQAIFDYASQRGNDIIFPIGKYKITAPLQIWEHYSSGWIRKTHPRIIGQGFSSFDTQYEGSTIIAYNLPDNRAAVELIGESNGAAAQSTIENITIHADHASNSNLSFALWVGDCWFFTARKVKLVGNNALMTRCGSAPNNGGVSSYAMIASKFEQCYFKVTSSKGYAVMPEFVENGNIGSGYDNLSFDSCLFTGLTLLYAYTVKLDNCMWSVNPRRDTVTYSSGLLNGYTVDFSNALWIANAMNAHINKGYFEDYRQGILLMPISGGAIRSTVIENTLMNSWTNYVDQTNTSTHYKADRAISIKKNPANTGWVEVVTIKNNYLCDKSPDGSGGFTDTVIRNEAAATLNVIDNVNADQSTTLRIVDTGSIKFHIVDPANQQAHAIKTVDFDITLANYAVDGFISGTNLKNYYMGKRTWVKRITIIVDRVLQSPTCNLSVVKSGNVVHSTDLTYLSDTTYTDNGCQVFIWENKMVTNKPAIFDSGDKLLIGTYITGINAADVGAKIKVKVELAS